MVGKLNDIVTAAAVVGAAEKVGNIQQPLKTEKTEGTQPVTKVENESLFEKDEQENFHVEPVDEETVDFMTKELNNLMSKTNFNLQFDYHQFEDVMTVRMIDKETDEVIKEMPPEDLVKSIMKAKIWLGAFIDKTF